MKIYAPISHPRYLSNLYRDILSDGVKKGLTSLQGLTAHGRGEAFDYLIGEKTHSFADHAVSASAAMLIRAKYPVVSVNGNTAMLVPKDLISLAEITDAKLEVNLFHRSYKREKQIVNYLKKLGANIVLTPEKNTLIPGIDSNRRMISKIGQHKADLVFVPLEDGDRTEGLISMGKKVITIDLNPLSRTAKTATITIVDNIVRTMPLLINKIREYKLYSAEKLDKIINDYNNRKVLDSALRYISVYIDSLTG
jgi:4-phosphopantoate---beta-alanine ligase